jgi:hypothetical protein
MNITQINKEPEEALIWNGETEFAIYGGIFAGYNSWARQTLWYIYGISSNYNILSDVAAYLALSRMGSMKKMLQLHNEDFEASALLFEYSKAERKLQVRGFGDLLFYAKHQWLNSPTQFLSSQLGKKTKQKYEYFDTSPIYTLGQSYLLTNSYRIEF